MEYRVQAFAQILTIIKDVVLKPLQTTIDALETKVKDIQKRIDGLREEEKRLIPNALKKLYLVQQNHVITRETMVSLAATTISRINSIIRVISKIGPRTSQVDVKVKILLRKFSDLLKNSHTTLRAVFEDYSEMNMKLNNVRADLKYFSGSGKLRGWKTRKMFG